MQPLKTPKYPGIVRVSRKSWDTCTQDPCSGNPRNILGLSEYPGIPGILRHKRPCTGGPRNILGLSEYPGKTGILRQWGLYMCTHGPRNILGSSNYPGILGILFQGHQTFCGATGHVCSYWLLKSLCHSFSLLSRKYQV